MEEAMPPHLPFRPDQFALCYRAYTAALLDIQNQSDDVGRAAPADSTCVMVALRIIEASANGYLLRVQAAGVVTTNSRRRQGMLPQWRATSQIMRKARHRREEFASVAPRRAARIVLLDKLRPQGASGTGPILCGEHKLTGPLRRLPQ